MVGVKIKALATQVRAFMCSGALVAMSAWLFCFLLVLFDIAV